MNNSDFEYKAAGQAFGIEGEPTTRQKLVLAPLISPIITLWNLAEFFMFELPLKLMGIDSKAPLPYRYTSEGIMEMERLESEARVARIKEGLKLTQ